MLMEYKIKGKGALGPWQYKKSTGK